MEIFYNLYTVYITRNTLYTVETVYTKNPITPN